jgi:hypothetical protein
MSDPTDSQDPEDIRAQLIAEAAKSKSPIAHLDPTSPWLPDRDAIVAEAIRRWAKDGNTETSGVIFKNADGNYAYSIPLTSARHDEFALRAQLPKGQTLGAILHSHPGNDDLAGYFSPHDVQMADKLGIPSYIRFDSDGSLRSYMPGKTKTSIRRTGAGQFDTAKVSRGDPVTALPASLYAETTP